MVVLYSLLRRAAGRLRTSGVSSGRLSFITDPVHGSTALRRAAAANGLPVTSGRRVRGYCPRFTSCVWSVSHGATDTVSVRSCPVSPSMDPFDMISTVSEDLAASGPRELHFVGYGNLVGRRRCRSVDVIGRLYGQQDTAALAGCRLLENVEEIVPCGGCLFGRECTARGSIPRCRTVHEVCCRSASGERDPVDGDRRIAVFAFECLGCGHRHFYLRHGAAQGDRYLRSPFDDLCRACPVMTKPPARIAFDVTFANVPL